MKKILMSALLVSSLVSSAMAFEFISKNERVVIFGGITNVDNADYFIGSIGNEGSLTAGYTGTKEEAGFSIAIGLEEKVKDGQFGSRKMITYYDDGKKIYGDGGYQEIFTDKGIEASYDIFYQLNNHFKPYVGVGIGMNDGTATARKYNTPAPAPGVYTIRWETSGHSYDATALFRVGITGEIAADIQYYAEYKYRMGGESAQVSTTNFGSTDNPNPVKHNTVTLGLGYKF